MKIFERLGRVLAVSLALAAVAAGCTSQQPGTATRGGSAVAARGMGTDVRSMQPAQFAAIAGGNGMYEVQVSRLAMNRANSGPVQDYARMLVDNHTRANNELIALLRAKGIRPPDMIPRDKRVKLDRLSSVPARQFDRMYIQTVGIEDHEADIVVFDRASREVADPELRAFAQKTLPVLRSHLDAARSLAATTR
ncbi:putative membrane protein [Variovorax boronicumulans]|uniref:Membrane protein n=1 Tax=Variovorax boronicumulans TaxID=436515 RepID=A0AAW8D0S5_9BURK|nr:DUF4142 domain-containing protein [Variovorax boronicumulans]MDP9897223.1 putative membrane protein [Variovorax boronicumulans]MDQ0057264.1 putative membrane protein [Variovorax boronicumulans]